MMSIGRTVLGILLIVGVFSINGLSKLAADELATSSQTTPEEEMVVFQPEEGKPSKGSVIGRLETRDEVITITAGPDGPLYTIMSREGRFIAVNLSGEELATRFPALHERIEKSLADPKIWAGTDLFRYEEQVEVRSP
jgi:hypothetical protein